MYYKSFVCNNLENKIYYYNLYALIKEIMMIYIDFYIISFKSDVLRISLMAGIT